jgi:hypothetical protein
MNLAESIKYVLKTRGQELFTSFWREDVLLVLAEFKRDFVDTVKHGRERFQQLRQQGLRQTWQEVRDSAADTVMILSVIPRRMQEGFTQFRDDFLLELEQQTDQKQKTVFSLKVIAALSGFALSAFYGKKQAKPGAPSITGLKARNAFTQYLVSELILKISRVFILRFLDEVETQLTDDEDLKNLRFFKGLLSDRQLGKATAELAEEQMPTAGDRALILVESLKNYILTGKKDG